MGDHILEVGVDQLFRSSVLRERGFLEYSRLRTTSWRRVEARVIDGDDMKPSERLPKYDAVGVGQSDPPEGVVGLPRHQDLSTWVDRLQKDAQIIHLGPLRAGDVQSKVGEVDQMLQRALGTWCCTRTGGK